MSTHKLYSPTSSEQDLPYGQFRSEILETVWLHLLYDPQEPEHDIRGVHGIHGNHHHMAYGVEEEDHLQRLVCVKIHMRSE